MTAFWVRSMKFCCTCRLFMHKKISWYCQSLLFKIDPKGFRPFMSSWSRQKKSCLLSESCLPSKPLADDFIVSPINRALLYLQVIMHDDSHADISNLWFEPIIRIFRMIDHQVHQLLFAPRSVTVDRIVHSAAAASADCLEKFGLTTFVDWNPVLLKLQQP